MRLVQQVLMAVVVFSLFHALGGIFSEQLTLISAVIMMILPPPFVLPLYIEETGILFICDLSIYDVIYCWIYVAICGSFALAYPKFYKNNIGYLSRRKSIGNDYKYLIVDSVGIGLSAYEN